MLSKLITWLRGEKDVRADQLKPGDEIAVGFLQYTVIDAFVNDVGAVVVEIADGSLGMNPADQVRLINLRGKNG